MAQNNSANKNDIAALVKKTDFGDKLKNLNKNVTRNRPKHVIFENELNELSGTGISTKGLTKDLINEFSLLNGAKYFSSGLFQNYLFLYQLKTILDILVVLLELILRNLMECQRKKLKI